MPLFDWWRSARKKYSPKEQPSDEVIAKTFQLMGEGLAFRSDPYAPFPDVGPEASKVVHKAIDQVGQEFGVQYRMVTGKDFEHGTLFFGGHYASLKHLAGEVDFLIEAPEADIFDSEHDRRMFVYIAPGWETISGPSGWPDLDMLFRVAAVSLDSADANEERRAANVWFDAASIELEKLRKMSEGSL